MSHFDVSWKVIPLKLKEVFTIARGSKSEVRNVFLKITKDGITGYGEAGPNTRYDETDKKVVNFFESLPHDFFDDLTDVSEIKPKLESLNLSNIFSARTAVEMAWLDWWAKSEYLPLWKLWDYESPVGPVTSYTIGIDTPEKMQQKVREASQYPVYKIKLGTDKDRVIIRAIREVTDKPLRVDANEGWTTLEQAKCEVEFLASQNVELIEQPMPASEIEIMRDLKQWSPLPLAADESFTGTESLNEIAEAFDVINIKLMKIGSLHKAREVIKQAKQLGLDIMIGCMIESSLANAAGALLGLQADYVDLDGHLLISNDVCTGLIVDENARVILSDKPGFGVECEC
ncbi:MAG: dipeptide epimerase [Gracilimonas sp.]|nr:dipeptide epimerase [Gracilimonas sp.]